MNNWWRSGQLSSSAFPPESWGVSDELQGVGEVGLVEGDLLCADVLHVPHTTVGKDMPLDLKFPKHLLQLRQDVSDLLGCACQLEVANMLGK